MVNREMLYEISFHRAFIWTKNIKEPRSGLWGGPYLTCMGSELMLFTITVVTSAVSPKHAILLSSVL